MATVPSPSSGETRVRAGCGGLRAWTVPGTGGYGPPGAGAVEVLAADHGVAQRALCGVVVQRQLRQVLVAGEAVPFVAEGGDDPGGGRVQQAVSGQSGLLDAGGVQAGEGPLVALERLLVCAGAGNGRGQGVVGPVQYGDPLCPRRAPFAQLVGVGGAGPQEVPADVGKAPERVHAVDAGQGLVSPMEVGGDDQAPAGLQRGPVKVDAQLA